MGERGKRPFWMHQLVEYILGGALVAIGVQSPSPLVPSILGAAVMFYTGATKGALSAFRVLDRRIHRWMDGVVIAVIVAAALQPWVSIDNGTRLIMGGVAAVYAVVWLGSSFEERLGRIARAKAAASGLDRSTEFGKKAGRFVGNGVNMAKAAKAKRDQQSSR